MDLEKIWETIKDFFVRNGWNILKFFLILFFGLVLIKLLMNILKRVLNKTHIEKITLQFLLAILKFLMYLVLLLSLLSVVGIQITGILTAFSAVVLAVGVALEKNIANFANGIIIVSTQMFNKGDHIICEDVEGEIQNINFLFTTVRTFDGKKIIMPNSDIVNNPVTNVSSYPTRRISLTFSVAYESDIELVKKIILDVIKSNGKVYLDRPILCRMSAMSASSIDFYSYCWVDNGDYKDVMYYILENVYNEFKRNKISVPYNQLEVRTRTDNVVMPVIGDGIPERVEKVRNVEERFDLENADLTEIFKRKKKNKSKNVKKSQKSSKNNNKNNNDKKNDIKNETKNDGNNENNNKK